MKQEEVNRIQSDLYEAFVKLDAFCRAQNIRYYFLGGTMLGAVRHQGFIPWDDDIDIGIPRRDYKRLLTLFGNQAIEGFSVYNFQTDPSCSFDFTKLMHTQKNEDIERNIFIDVFPLDGCPFSSNAMISVYFWMFNVLRILKNSHYMSLEGKNALKRTVVMAARKIRLSRWNSLMDRFLERHDFDTSKAGGNFSGHWAAKEIMNRSVYGKPTPIHFQDGMFFGVEQLDLYLRRMYGDYMKMPSEEERLSHFS